MIITRQIVDVYAKANYVYQCGYFEVSDKKLIR